jgi:hypothetical protein
MPGYKSNGTESNRKQNVWQWLHVSTRNSISAGILSVGRALVLPSIVVEVIVGICVRDTMIYPISG